MRFVIFFGLLLSPALAGAHDGDVGASGVEAATCVGKGESCDADANPISGEVDLLQVRMEIASHNRSRKAAEAEHPQKITDKEKYRYQPYKMRPALVYFQSWSKEALPRRMATRIDDPDAASGGDEIALAAGMAQALSVERAAELLETHRVWYCSASARRDMSGWILHDSDVDDDGVQHLLLRSPKGTFQHLAVHREHILVADPPACPKHAASLLQQPNGTDIKLSVDELGGEEQSLDPGSDKLVSDCEALFHRTANENCGTDWDIEVLSSTVHIIDGLEVKMDCAVKGPSGETVYHSVWCDFEASLGQPDAKFLQLQGMEDEDENQDGPDELPEEKAGLVATLVMTVDICNCPKKGSISLEEEEAMKLMQDYPMGEISRYKGFEHVNDNIPMASVSSLLSEAAPTNYHIYEKYPMCFPTLTEVVRNQGGCGSCWAFASASATMTNLCVSGKGEGSLAKSDDRYEVSTQLIMACNSGSRGCNGGNAGNVASAFEKAGIARERDVEYLCGSGDPLKHFEEKSGTCDRAPWGRTCTTNKRNPEWNWGSATGMSGETDIKAVVATGNALYASFDTYSNFMTLKSSEIYSSNSGSKKGGHAVTLVGYGVQSGTKYWTIQNSWGPRWCNNGYAKFKRGVNLAGIEDAAYYMRAYVNGGVVPHCFEGKSSGLRAGSGDISCEQAKSGPYGNLCNHARFKDTVKGNCPVTCGACVGGTPGEPAPGPAPAPYPKPSNPTTAEPVRL